MKILVVEDDELNAYALTTVLSDQNYAVEIANDGNAAWDLVETYDYDLILLDIMLPKLDGISLCKKIRSSGRSVPILLLTGCDSSHEKAIGLDAGADDYVVKPFEPEELVARVRALLRRGGVASQPILEWGNLRLDPSNCEVTYNQNLLSLTPKEYALLELFLRNNRRVFSCGMILEHLWSYEDTPGEEAVRTHIKGLRMKLRSVGANNDFIETVYGIGYRLKAQEEEGEQATSRERGGEVGEVDEDDTNSKSQRILTAIADIWQRFYGRINQQVSILEQAALVLTPQLRTQAVAEAHTLAGSLGTFGLKFGSELARKIENLLKSSKTLSATETTKLQTWVKLLRQEIEGKKQENIIPSTNTQELPLVMIADQDSIGEQRLTDADETLAAAQLADIANGTVTSAVATGLQNQANYQQLVELFPEAILVETQGKVVLVNSAAVKLFGAQQPTKLLGKQLLDFVSTNSKTGVEQQLQNLRTNQQSIPLHEEQFLRLDGTVIDVEIVAAAVTYQGKPAAQIVIRDITQSRQTELALYRANEELELRVAERTAELITVNHQLQAQLDERRRTQEALRISQTRFEGILSIADDAIISIDGSQRITLFNQGAEKIFGYSADEVLGKDLDMLLPMRFSEQHRHHITDFGKSPSPARRMGERREIFGRHKDGTEFPAEASISKLDMGNECVYTVILRDITDRKQVEKMKDEFVSVVSHELRTPLTSIHGSLGMLASGLLPTDSEQGKRLLQIATDSTERLVRLINDILDIERIESGKVKMERETCNLQDLIASAVNIMQPLADKAGVNLSISSVPVQLWADPDRIVQTITNLLSNAIKFSTAESTVWLTAQQQNEQILLTVKDSGRGIPVDKLESIFERFQQVDSSDSRNHEGTGLGLAICKSIVQQHSGKIWVESTLGVGSSFYFTLPFLAINYSDDVEDYGVDQSITEQSYSPLVLVCDDDDLIRLELQNLLEKGGYRVITVGTGEEAIAQAVTTHPDVIVLDLLMPKMNGWETMAVLKEREDTQNIPIVICSVYKPSKSSSPNAEFVDWLSKPVEEISLLHSLSKVVNEPSRKVKILIVEDDHDLANLLATLFERHDIDTFIARTGREAIHVSQKVNPDLLILDLILPESDGFTVVDWLKQHNQLCSIPVVVYSAKDLDVSERHRLKLGHTEFLTKGRVTTSEFEQRVMSLLKKMTHRN
ncbi:response regulator [Sphaerospermopsis aphanizomenoides BCCUSP55]|uniref:response regulator n=1 Tax=Sphaerospermopsis aphanizomenoides TaxID=459663 RepID=UPI0019069898|nr:response regulator [Sphaerospermopsis aphanizomenoides]MBK1987738.1 response regulator [Sphaerospermopsis aphanizomenoides BCCUSP55]